MVFIFRFASDYRMSQQENLQCIQLILSDPSRLPRCWKKTILFVVVSRPELGDWGIAIPGGKGEQQDIDCFRKVFFSFFIFDLGRCLIYFM